MNVLPGEPAPPGFEEEINRVAFIQTTIDVYKENALIGLEYTLELHNDGQRVPSYICLLCDKRLMDIRSIMQHWTSYYHRMEYLEKHFPTLAKEIKTFKYRPNPHPKVMSVLQSVADAIEDHHGRLKPCVCNGDDFRRMKAKITNDVISKYHYDERNGPNFLEIVKRETLQITIKTGAKRGNELSDNYNRDLDEISSEDDLMSSSKKQKKHDGSSPHQRNLPRVRRSPPFEEERFGEDGEGNDRNLTNSKEGSINDAQYGQDKRKWEQYKNMLDNHINQMEKNKKEYDKNPEKHPLYTQEWIQFWNRRYKELQAEKKVNPNKYDYKPEWIEFWEKRMKDLYDEDIELKKKEFKKKLNIPEDAEENSEFGQKFKQANRNNGKLTTRNEVTDVINISDDEENDKHMRRPRPSRSRSSSISISPLPRRNYSEHERNREPAELAFKKKYIKIDARTESPEVYDRIRRAAHFPPSRSYPIREREIYTEGSNPYSRFPPAPGHFSRPQHYRVMDSHNIPSYDHSPSPGRSKMDGEIEDDEPLTVVAVLRLLTALESDLGSSGPKVVDLLAKALALEKFKANSSEELLLNEDTCVFFETIKEKLKGLLIAEVIDDPHKVKVVKKTVKNIATIIHLVNGKGLEKAKSNDSNNKNDSVKNQKSLATIKDLPFDRQLIATKLAAALVNAGRDDISTDEMDKLIFFFILMVKLSKEKALRNGGGGGGGTILTIRDLHIELGLPKSDKTNEIVSNKGNMDDYHDEEQSLDKSDKDPKEDHGSSILESLTDSDLQTLLQNFKQLSTEEQHHLIAHLKKLETADPVRVEKLRKFVNIASFHADSGNNNNNNNNINDSPKSFSNDSINRNKNSSSNFNNDHDEEDRDRDRNRDRENDDKNGCYDRRNKKSSSSNINANKFCLDDDDEDDDYNFEEVFKAASRKASNDIRNKDAGPSRNEPIVPVSSSPTALTFNRAGFSSSNGPNDTQNLIANLMGNIKQNNAMEGNKKMPTNLGLGDLRQIPSINNTKGRSMIPHHPQVGGVGGGNLHQQHPQNIGGNPHHNQMHPQQGPPQGPPQGNQQMMPPQHQMTNFNPQMMGGPPNMDQQYPYQGPPANNYDNYNSMMQNQQNMYYGGGGGGGGNPMGNYDQSNNFQPQWNHGQQMPFNQMPYNPMAYGGGGYNGN